MTKNWLEFKTPNIFIIDKALLCNRDLVLVDIINDIQDLKYKAAEIETGKFKILDKLSNLEIVGNLSVEQVYKLLIGLDNLLNEKISTEIEERLKFFSTKNTSIYYLYCNNLL